MSDLFMIVLQNNPSRSERISYRGVKISFCNLPTLCVLEEEFLPNTAPFETVTIIPEELQLLQRLFLHFWFLAQKEIQRYRQQKTAKSL